MVVPRRAASSRSCRMTVSSIFSVVFTWQTIRAVFQHAYGLIVGALGPVQEERAPAGAARVVRRAAAARRCGDAVPAAAGHPRRQVHFTLTLACRLNEVERFFALLPGKQLRRGVHRSTQELEPAIRGAIDTVNADLRPFRRTKSADEILATSKRWCLGTLDGLQRHKEISKASESTTCVTM